MKRNRLYRIGAGLLAGLLVFTGVPQTYSFAEEIKKADDETAAYIEMQADDSLIGDENSHEGWSVGTLPGERCQETAFHPPAP